MAESLAADAGAGLKALGINCTLKKSPEASNTEALMNRVLGILDEHGVETEILRPADYEIKFGVSSDEGDGDEWPQILEKIKAADILLMGMSIWFGVRSSVCQMVIERLDGTYNERNEVGQYPLYNKVAGVVVTGNEDGAHACAETTLFNMTHLGCVVPPNADTYWVGDAGPGPSYLEAGGQSTLHAADQLLVRAQPAPHGPDHAGEPDPADREHSRGDGRRRHAHRVATSSHRALLLNMLCGPQGPRPRRGGNEQRGERQDSEADRRAGSGRRSRSPCWCPRRRPRRTPWPSTAASTRSTSPAPSPGPACGSSARARRSRRKPVGSPRWRPLPPGSRPARATGSVPPTAPSRCRVGVMRDRSAPKDPSIYNQTLPAGGYGYLTTRDGTSLAIDVRLPGPRPPGPIRPWSSTRATDTPIRPGPQSGISRSSTCSATRSST